MVRATGAGGVVGSETFVLFILYFNLIVYIYIYI